MLPRSGSVDGTLVETLLANLAELRHRRSLSRDEVEALVEVGPGWIEAFEKGTVLPDVPMALTIAKVLEADFPRLLEGLTFRMNVGTSARGLSASAVGKDLEIRFPYGKHDAVYHLPNATKGEFAEVITSLRQGLAKATAMESRGAVAVRQGKAVADTFLRAVAMWPHLNPSDVWWFVLYRAYCDRYNHPVAHARLDLGQSWKRTAGWALERVLVDHYGAHLGSEGVMVCLATEAVAKQVVRNVEVGDRLEPAKMDVLLFGADGDEAVFFGVVHVKSSFAERRTDDVPMSRALVDAGFTSPLWTMDCKSTPAAKPVNRGELGPTGTRRSAKRKDIEDDGYFSGCFSYNTNTIPSSKTVARERRVYQCSFGNPADEFSRFIRNQWKMFRDKEIETFRMPRRRGGLERH